MSQPKKTRKIATEEAFCIPEVADELAKVARAPGNSLDIPLLKMIYDNGGQGRMADMRERLIDLEDRRHRSHRLAGLEVHHAHASGVTTLRGDLADRHADDDAT